MQNATRLACKHINKAGGILGRKLVLIHMDSGSLPTPAVDAATKLVKVHKVPAIVGAFSSGVTMAVVKGVTVPNRVVQIGQGCTSPMLSILKDEDYFFRTCMQDLYQGAALAELMWNDGHKKISILYANNPYGVGMCDAITQRFRELGGKVIHRVPYNLGKPSYKAELGRAFSHAPSAVAMLVYPQDAIVMFKQGVEAGYNKTPWYGCDAWKVEEVIEGVGAKFLNGIRGTGPGVLESPSLETFVKEYEEEFGEKPSVPFMEPGYDAVIAIACAIVKAGKPPSKLRGIDIKNNIREPVNAPGEVFYAGPEEIKKGLEWIKEGKDTDYVGCASRVEFDKWGDTISSVEVWEIREGKFVSITNLTPKPVDREKLGPRYMPQE
jgi:branched-chain amino acid transport system substrate-binding protein